MDIFDNPTDMLNGHNIYGWENYCGGAEIPYNKFNRYTVLSWYHGWHTYGSFGKRPAATLCKVSMIVTLL